MVQHAKKEWIMQLTKMWKEAFGDEIEYINTFFDTIFREEHSWCYVQQEEPVAVIHGIKGLYYTKQQGALSKVPVFYYYAGATNKAYQKKGYYGEIMRYLLEEAAKEGASMLVPVNELIPYYVRMGFVLNQKQEDCTISKEELAASASKDAITIETKEIDASLYKTLRDQWLGKPGYIEWDLPMITFALYHNSFCGGVAREVIVDGQRHMLMANPGGACLKVIETTLTKEQLLKYGQLLVEFFGCEQLCIKGITFMSGIQDWEVIPYLNLILDE